MNDNRNFTSRGDDPYTDSVKAEIIALVCETGNISEAAREMANNNHERSPSPELIGYWLKEHDPENFGALSE